MSENRKCPTCGVELMGELAAGLCPKCLLESGLSEEWAGDEIPTGTSPAKRQSGFVPPTLEELALLFPQLEILKLLGHGGMGAVYKARQRALDRFVALKILPNEVGQLPGFAERFAREARALALLSHPHIVTVHDFGKADSLFYFVMEYVDGLNLRQVIETGGPDPQSALAIVPQICDALQFAHEEGVVHRDIKPENVLLDRRGRVKIADFGLAKLLGRDSLDASLTATHQVMGTPRYMAPEQMEGSRAVDHRADIYSLGVVFYELLTGELPLGRFEPPSRKVQIDVRFDEVVLRALEKEPEQRYQRASEVKTEVDTIAKTTSFRPQHTGNKPMLPKNPSRLFAVRPLLLTLFFLLFVVVLFAVMHSASRTDIFLVVAALGIFLWSLLQIDANRCVKDARGRGLWPQPSESPAIEHVTRLVQAGETGLAIKLYRQIYSVSLKDAKAFVNGVHRAQNSRVARFGTSENGGNGIDDKSSPQSNNNSNLV